MALTINTSHSFMRLKRDVDDAQSLLQVSLQRISTGMRINTSRDDAAGLAISERLSSRLRGALASIRNMNTGASLLQVIDGALNESQSALMRMRELSVIAAGDLLTDIERRALNVEFNLLNAQLNSIAEQTNFNGIHLLNGEHTQLELQVGTDASDRFRFDLAKVTANELGRQARYTTQRRGVFASDLNTGDLQINGVSIRGTAELDDTISYSYNSGSAIAKAAAINDSTVFTGVRAIVGHNVIRGFEPIRDVSLDPQRFFKVNGHPITAIHVEAKDATGSLVESINAGYDETGVVAEVDQDGHLILTAEDGRNITVEYGVAEVRDAIRMIDYNGDFINLVNTVDPVQTDLDGDIDSVTFTGTGTYDGSHSIIGDVTIVGNTSNDATGGYERPRDNVDIVLEVIKPGAVGVATYRFKEEVIGDQVIDSLPEDYLFNNEGVVTSANASKVSIEPASFYNEASDRTFTLTVTKNGLPSAANLADIPEFTVSMQNGDEASDTSLIGPFQAIEGSAIDIGYGISIDFPVGAKHALRPNGSTLNTGNDLTRTGLGGDDTYKDHPQYRSWTGDRTTYFTYEVVSAGHAAGNAAIAGSQTGAAQVEVTAVIPSLGTTSSTIVTLNPNNSQDITYQGMTTRFVRRFGSAKTSESVGGSYQGNFRANDSVYVGSEKRIYEIEVLEAGPLKNTSALDARINVRDSGLNLLQTYTINNLRSGAEFELGQGAHFEGAVADFTASSSQVGAPSSIGGAPNIVSRINNNYLGTTDETAVIEVTQAGRPGSAQYRYYYQSAPGATIASGVLNSGALALPDGVQLNITDTPPPEFSAFNANGLSLTRDASGYSQQQDASFTASVQTVGGAQELKVDWVFADGFTTTQIVALPPGHVGNQLNIGYGVLVGFDLASIDGDTFSGSLEANELEVGDQWSVDLSAGRVEVGDTFTVATTPRTLDIGTKWEVTGEVPMWEVGDTYTVNAQHNFHDQIHTLTDTISLVDPNTGDPLMGDIKLDGLGSFNTGDELRVRTRGFTGVATSSGLYTDNLYPTNYIVTITHPGGVGVAEYDWVREDGRVDTQFGGSGSGKVTAFNVPFLLEEGVFLSFTDNGSGDTYFAVGDQFVIPAGQKLEYTFSGEVTLQSDENIELSHANDEVVNTLGRLIYEGDSPNEAGTDGNLLSGGLGTNTEISVDDLHLLNQVSAERALDTIDEALDQVSATRAQVGAALNRLERRVESEGVTVEQLTRARQRIRDADIAVEVSELTRAQTRQSAAPLLAQVARLNLERSLSLLTSLA